MFLDEILERNHAWADRRHSTPLPEPRAVRLAVVACYDPRLDPLLRPALCLAEGDGFLLRTAGALLTPDDRTLRTLALAVYMFEVRQILVLGHSSCRMASFETTRFIDAFRGRGVRRGAFGDVDLRTWAGAIPDPRQGVLRSLSTLFAAPFLPPDLEIAGALLDDASGRIEAVHRPGDPLPDLITTRPPDPGAEPAAEGPPDESSPEEPRPGRQPPGIPPPPPADAPRAFAPIGEALATLVEPHLGERWQELVRMLQAESDVKRQLTFIQRFLQREMKDSKELRQAFNQLRQELVKHGPQTLPRLLAPFLHGGRPK